MLAGRSGKGEARRIRQHKQVMRLQNLLVQDDVIKSTLQVDTGAILEKFDSGFFRTLGAARLIRC